MIIIFNHFHEVSIIMKGKFFKELDDIHIDNINRVKADVFACECNWSTVTLEYE